VDDDAGELVLVVLTRVHVRLLLLLVLAVATVLALRHTARVALRSYSSSSSLLLRLLQRGVHLVGTALRRELEQVELTRELEAVVQLHLRDTADIVCVRGGDNQNGKRFHT
jgi:hypothetical protein